MDLVEPAGIVFDRVGAIGRIRLARPESLNALDVALVREFENALDALLPASRVLILCGGERAFSSGASLGPDVRLDDPGFDAGAPLQEAFNPLLTRLRELDVPVVAAVRGVCAGVACALALTADVVVMGEGAGLMFSFRRIGLVPDGAVGYLLTRAIGRPRAMELLLFGRTLRADESLAWGLVNRVAPDESVDEVALELAGELARGPHRALGAIRRGVWAALDQSHAEQLELDRRLQREAGRTREFQEGVAAFREKRTPRFEDL